MNVTKAGQIERFELAIGRSQTTLSQLLTLFQIGLHRRDIGSVRPRERRDRQRRTRVRMHLLRQDS